jgi:hypothetical protein
MQYNSHATAQDCVSEILKISGATTATYPLVDITRRFNSALDWYIHLAAKAGKRWPFDDSNQTSAPLVTQNLASGTNSYKWSAFSGSILYTNKLIALDDNAKPHTLTPEEFIEADFENSYLTTVTGIPTHYTKFGDFIYVRPTPNYSETNGLQAYVVRQALYMASTDTTKTPGVPVIHHNALCRFTALPFLIENRLPQAQAIAQVVQKDEMDILAFHGYRNNDMPSRLSPLTQNNR